MSDSAHLLIPFASSHAGGCVEARATLALPRLEKLLSRLERAELPMPGDETSLSMPHERVLARECGLAASDGLIPWAAWQVRRTGGDPAQAAWAVITPCHWRVGSDHVAMDDPQHLQLEESDARALFAAMQPYFEEDAIALTYETPGRWLARGDVFRELATASLDRVVGRAVDVVAAARASRRTLATAAAGDADAAVHQRRQRRAPGARTAAGEFVLDQRHRRAAIRPAGRAAVRPRGD